MYAIIDIGSNTIRMVLYKVIDNEIQQMLNSKIPAGLAGYIDNNNMLSKKGILKAIEALSKFETILESVDVKEVHAFATASLRNISNSEEVLAEIKKHCSFDIETFRQRRSFVRLLWYNEKHFIRKRLIS